MLAHKRFLLLGDIELDTVINQYVLKSKALHLRAWIEYILLANLSKTFNMNKTLVHTINIEAEFFILLYLCY